MRHSYADTRRWGLPGGGYKPDRETPAQAASREINEELHLNIGPERFTVLETTVTTREGKHDTLTILAATSLTDGLKLSAEIAEARWIGDLSELGDAPVSRWLVRALS